MDESESESESETCCSGPLDSPRSLRQRVFVSAAAHSRSKQGSSSSHGAVGENESERESDNESDYEDGRLAREEGSRS